MKKTLIFFIMFFTICVVNLFSTSNDTEFDYLNSIRDTTWTIEGYALMNGGSGNWGYALITAYADSLVYSTIPDISGYFIIAGIVVTLPDTIIVTVTLENYYPDTLYIYVPSGATSGSLILNPMPATISGTVILNGGCGEITEAIIEVDGNTTHPDSVGNYSIDVDLIGVWTPAYYDVTASLENYEDSTITNVEVMENQTTPDIDFILYACVAINDNNVGSLFYLSQNYPNPFNPTTTINYQLPEDSEVEIIIYNIKGEKVKTLVNEVLTAGEHSAIWDGRDSNDKRVSSGIYFYKLRSGNIEISKKMLMMK